MRLRQVRPAAARAVETRVGSLGLAVILLLVVATVWSIRDHALPALLSAGGAALLTNVLSTSCAWGACTLLGLPRAQRVAIGLECGLQNFALAAFVALTLMRDSRMLLPGIAYGLTMWGSAAVLVLRARRAVPRPSLPAQNHRNW
jgi:BASS family bile acid:Na+ symporter